MCLPEIMDKVINCTDDTDTTHNDLDHETPATGGLKSYWALRKNFAMLFLAAILFSHPPLNASFG